MNCELFSVDHKVVIITGASRGIGRTLAEGFLEHGSRVTLVARSAEPLQQLAAAYPDTALDLPCDIGQPETSTRICDETLERFHTIDVLINCAGVSGGEGDPYGDDVWDRTLHVNLKAAFQISRAACEIMSECGGGSIINIASIGAILGFPNNPAYQASKAGLKQLTKALARDWGSQGIRLNAIAPGSTETPMLDRLHEPLA
ncbi:MAG: SDR family oxidoreductase, partial [Planctomycetaceae bacterium]